MTSRCQIGSNLLPRCVRVIPGEWDASGLKLSSFRAFLPRKEEGPASVGARGILGGGGVQGVA